MPDEELVATVIIRRKSNNEIINTVSVDRVVIMRTNKSLLQYPHSNGRRIMVLGPVHSFTLEGEIHTSAEEFLKYVDENSKPAMADIESNPVNMNLSLSSDNVDGKTVFSIQNGQVSSGGSDK